MTTGSKRALPWAANRALDRFAPVFETEGAPISSDRIDKALKAALKGDETAREEEIHQRERDQRREKEDEKDSHAAPFAFTCASNQPTRSSSTASRSGSL